MSQTPKVIAPDFRVQNFEPPEIDPRRLPLFLSVVVLLFDAGERVLGNLRSIVDMASELVSDFEIILVDNGSNAAAAPNYKAITGVEGLPNVQVFRLIAKVDPETAAENSLGDYVFVLDPLDEALSPLPRALNGR